MKSKYVLSVVVIVVSAMSTGSASGQPAKYALDPSHTSVVFGVSHLGYSFTYGRFNKVDGHFVFDKNSPTNSQFTVTIDAASVDTNDAKRDEHLRNADFFNVRQFPTIEFRSTQVDQNRTGLQLVGNMVMHGETKQITIPLQKVGEGKGPYGNYRMGFQTQFNLKRSDFGMRNMIGPVGDDVSIIMSFEGILQP